MPIRRRKDIHGSYYQWGNHGAKYYYTPNDKSSRENAKNLAGRQAKAAYSAGYRGK